MIVINMKRSEIDIEKRKLNFIENAKKIHNNSNLDYSKVEYKNNRTNVIIIDHELDENGKEYGEFEVTPSNHLKGHCHPKKRGKRISLKKRYTTEKIIEMFKEKHKNEKLDYSLVEYKGMDIPVTIICNELDENGEPYGKFEQTPRIHLKGCTHQKLSRNRVSMKIRKDTEYFIKRAKEIHGDKYDYSKVNYIKNDIEVCIICPKHGEFYITPENFYAKKGCPRCGHHLSYNEDEISIFLSKYVDIKKNDRSVLNGKEIDIFIPSKNIGIEYNGLRWHSELFGKDKNYHLDKTEICENKGVKLLQIFEDEFLNNKELVLCKILHSLNINNRNKIMGRKCEIVEIDNTIAKTFLNNNCIEGYCESTTFIGAIYNTKIIGVMSLNDLHDNWEITRFATDYNFICQGVIGKMFMYFIRKYKPYKVITFADRRWVNKENVYNILGFKLKTIIEPNYKLYKTIKHKGMKEYEEYYKIWDCGKYEYIWENK